MENKRVDAGLRSVMGRGGMGGKWIRVGKKGVRDPL